MRIALALAAVVAGPMATPDVSHLVLRPQQVGATFVMLAQKNGNLVNGAVTLNTNLKIDTGSGDGDITFTAANVTAGAGTGRIDSPHRKCFGVTFRLPRAAKSDAKTVRRPRQYSGDHLLVRSSLLSH